MGLSEQAAPHLVLVLGVHRSGTSLMTAGLAALGCDMGRFTNRSSSENPKGFFEHPVARELNDRLMAARGTSWSNWAYDATADELDALADWQDQAGEALRGSFRGPGPFVLKDPRISTLLPFWEATLARMGWRISRVLMLRDPLEVADSQARRAATNPPPHSMLRHGVGMAALWATTMRTVLASLPDDRTLLVGHAALYERPEETLQACAEFLRAAPPPGAIEAFARDFLDPALRRARGGAAPAAGWPELAAGLFQALRPEVTPRPLPMAEAREVLSRQDKLAALMPFLPPVALSLSQAGTALAEARQELAGLHRLLRPLADAAGQGPATRAVTRALATLVTERQAWPTHPSLLVLAARLHERAGDVAAAEAAWRELAALQPRASAPLRGLAQLIRRADRAAEAAAVEAELARRLAGAAG